MRRIAIAVIPVLVLLLMASGASAVRTRERRDRTRGVRGHDGRVRRIAAVGATWNRTDRASPCDSFVICAPAAWYIGCPRVHLRYLRRDILDSALLVKSDGSVAWIVETGYPVVQYQVHTVDKSGSRVLASGTDIDPRTLALSGGVLYWTQGGKPMSAVLNCRTGKLAWAVAG
jgi:hypothetical protein